MKSVGIRELKRDATRIMRKVREEGTSYEVTYRGRTIARIVPTEKPTHEAEKPQSFEEFLAEWDAMDESKVDRPVGDYAVGAIRESRRRIE